MRNSFAYAGQKIRAVIAWNTTTSYIRYPSMPAIDLDLFVYTPGGSLVASSASFDNTYEIVEFTAPETNYYYLTENQPSFVKNKRIQNC